MAVFQAGRRLLLLWASFHILILTNLLQCNAVLATPTAIRRTATYSSSSPLNSSSSISLSPDITDFIPACARSCFQSFVDINFQPTGVCGSSPSLQCLCSQTGSTGYTIGEGATECIVAEDNVGRCVDMAFGSDTVSTAYAMCDNQPSAAPETHATLIATLIVGSGSIVLASPTATPTLTSTFTSSTSTTTPASTGSSTAPSSVSSSTATPAATSTFSSSPTTASGAAADRPLTNAQIGGLAGGLAAIAVLATVIALVLFIRRRRGFAHMLSDGESNHHSHHHWTPPSKRDSGSTTLPISQPRYREPKSMSFTRALAKRMSGGTPPSSSSSVGLAISRNMAPEQPSPPPPAISPQRALSHFNFAAAELREPPPAATARGLPMRPTLTVAIPKRVSSDSSSTTARNIFHGGRDSVVTEFAEDGEEEEEEGDENTAAAAATKDSNNKRLSVPHGSAKIWRPPTSGPLSAATYYVADRWGNWVLGGARSPADVHELATPISKTVEEQQEKQDQEKESEAVKAAVRKLSPTTQPNVVVASARRSEVGGNNNNNSKTIRLVTPDSGRLPINSRSRSSSVYSQYPSTRTVSAEQEEYDAVPPLPTHPTAAESHRRKSAAAAGRAVNNTTRDSGTTIMSVDSSTTIADSPTLDDLDAFPLPLRRSHMPVVAPPPGQQVRYPAIPPSSSSSSRPLHHQPSRQPEFRDSPTLGLSPPPASAPAPLNLHQQQQQQQRNISPASAHDQHQQQLYMPRKRASLFAAAAAAGDRALLPSQQRYGSGPTSACYDAYNDPAHYQQQQPLSTAQQQEAELLYGGGGGGSLKPQHSPSFLLPSPSPPSEEEGLPYPSSETDPSVVVAVGMGKAGGGDDEANHGSGSNLLTKRLGAERAAAFQIEGAAVAAAAQRSPWARKRNSGGGGDGGTRALTPKKRGDDLYLSVG